MRAPLFKSYLFLTIVFVAIVVLTNVLHSIDKDSPHQDYQFNRKKKDETSDKKEELKSSSGPSSSTVSTGRAGGDKLVIDYHKRTQKDAPETGNVCGVGWKFANNVTGCARDLKWPNAVDEAMQDDGISQCANFFAFSCGSFIKDPLNMGKDAAFSYAHQVASNTMRFITSTIIDSTTPEESKISGFYHACMEHSNDAEEFRKSSTLHALLALVDQTVRSYDDLPFVWGSLQRYDTILPLELTFELDPSDSTRLIPMIKQSGLFDDQLMLDSPEHFADLMSRMSTIAAKNTMAADWAKQIIAIEHTILSRSVRGMATNIIDYLENYRGREDVVHDWKSSLAHIAFNVTRFIEAADPGSPDWMTAVTSRPLWCYKSDFLEKLPEILRQHSIASWIAYTKHAILFHIDNGNTAPRLDPDSHYAYHRMYDSRYSLPWTQPRRFLMQPVQDKNSQRDICLSLTEAYLPVVLDNYFINSYLPDKVKSQATEVAFRIKHVFSKLVRSNKLFSFLPEFDRLSAADKVDSVRVQIGTPNVWPIDRSALTVDPESYAESVLLIRKYHVDTNYMFFVQHTQGVLQVNGDTLFDGLVSNANAYYQHQINTIIITAGLIQPPLFSILFDKASVYARFGVTVAHELAHSIDAVGVLFDATGTYQPWLSYEGTAAYAVPLKCLSDVYSVRTMLGNMHDGKKTLNENFADVIGLTVAYQSFVEDVGPSLTTQQRKDFFMSYAQVHCASMTKSQEMVSISKRTHALGEFRVNNVVTQHPDFDSLWSCSRYDRGNHLKNTCPLF